jgi:hypothetical protein
MTKTFQFATYIPRTTLQVIFSSILDEASSQQPFLFAGWFAHGKEEKTRF